MSSIIPVVFCFDKRIILGASVAIKSLIDCAKEDTIYSVIILHSDLSLRIQKQLTKLFDKQRHNISFYYVNPEKFSKVPRSKGSWTEIVYYRLYAAELLSQYDKIIYSDVDVLFKNDLTELYNYDVQNYEFGAVKAEKNHPDTIGHKYFEENKNNYIFWSGLMLINCKRFRENKIFDKLIENAYKYNEKLKFFDLDLVNITCDYIKPLPLKYCVLQSFMALKDFKLATEYSYLKDIYSDNEILEAKLYPAIVHYAGKMGKPWRMKNPYPDYLEYMNKLPKELKKYTFRDI